MLYPRAAKECESHYATPEGGARFMQCGKSGGQCLTTGPFCEPPSCTAGSVISNNVAANDNRLESSRSGGYVVDLANGDTVWSQNTYGSNQRGLGQAFDGSSARNWNRAWHGQCHGPDYKAAPLQLRYTFQSGDHVITSVKVWKRPRCGAPRRQGRCQVLDRQRLGRCHEPKPGGLHQQDRHGRDRNQVRRRDHLPIPAGLLGACERRQSHLRGGLRRFRLSAARAIEARGPLRFADLRFEQCQIPNSIFR